MIQFNSLKILLESTRTVSLENTDAKDLRNR